MLVIQTYIHTYIIGHYNPSVRIIDLVSHTTYVMRVNFIYKWRYLQFKVGSERQIFWETFNGNFILLSEFLPEICWKEIAEEILFVFRLWCQDNYLVFHTTYVMSVNFYMSNVTGTYSLKSIPNYRFLRNFSW